MSIATRTDDAHEVATKLSSEQNFNSSTPSHSSTCFSLGHIPTVRFAPLPSPDHNRRRSNLPLGVAARSRRRRSARESRQQGRSLWTNDPAADPLLEDPFVTLGKFVKSATKNLWRRVRERNGLVEQVEPLQHDVVLDIRPMDGQEQLVDAVSEQRQAVEMAERPMIDNDLKSRWRRSTGSTMPSGPGLH
ncbi:hypothetical protein EDD22DRAFT_890778 [Suillus occidentalis]|nr:hypothetical protein EDD22DRAFT_890778 [Suillus occidentalis]